jgi:hypothetical protein
VVPDGEWDVYVVNEVREWSESLDEASRARVVPAIDMLAEHGRVWGGRWWTRSTARRWPT